MNPVAQHYAQSALVDRLLNALRTHGVDTAKLSPDHLAPLDEFHIRGREATEELAALATPQADWHVLDVGSGIGGSARYLASRFGCRVTGIDLTPEFCDAATDLTRRVGLDTLVRFRCASALAMPLEDASVDLAWTQHAQMNIAAKEELYREIARVTRPGGLFVFHDILAGTAGQPHFPVPWADNASLSALLDPETLRLLLERVGFRVLEWRDTTNVAHRWFLAAMERSRNPAPGQPPPLGVHLLLTGDAPAKMGNVARNLHEGRITVFQALLRRESSPST